MTTTEETDLADEAKKVQTHRKRALGLAVATSLLSKGGTMVLQLLAIPLVINLLGEGRFGVYAALQTLMWFIGMSDMGVGAGIGRRLTVATSQGNKDEQSRVLSTGFFMMTTVLLVVGLAGAVVLLSVPVETLFGKGFGPYADELRFNLWLGGGIFLSLMVIGILLKVREANQEIHLFNLFGAIGNVVAALLLMSGIRHVPQIWFILVSIYGVQVVLWSINATLALRSRTWLLPRVKWFDTRLAKILCTEGVAYFFLLGVTPILGREFIRWLLGQYYNPETVAYFSILVQLGFFMFSLVFMITYPLSPAVVDATARHDYDWVRAVHRRLSKLWLLGTLAVIPGFALLGPWFVRIWIRKEVPLGSLELGTYSVLFMLTTWTHIYCMLLAGIGKIKAAAWIAVMESAAICIGAWIGVKMGGMVGSVVGATIGMLATSFYMLPILFRKSLAQMQASAPGRPGVVSNP